MGSLAWSARPADAGGTGRADSGESGATRTARALPRRRLSVRIVSSSIIALLIVLGYQDLGRQFWLGLRWLPGQD